MSQVFDSKVRGSKCKLDEFRLENEEFFLFNEDMAGFVVCCILKFLVKVLIYFGRTERVKLEEKEFWLLFQIYIML